MRIEAYSQVQQVYTTKKTNKAEAKRNGSYEVSADSFAEKLFSKYEEMR